MPDAAFSAMIRMVHFINKYTAMHFHEPTIDEIHKFLNKNTTTVSKKLIKKLMVHASGYSSLDCVIQTDSRDSIDLHCFVGDQGKMPYDDLCQRELKEDIRNGIKKLSDREQKIIYERFYNNKTLEETSEYFKITRERVRQIQKVALKKLRKVI